MPSIKPYAGKYRAQVYKNGQRASKLFDTRREALEWGNAKEEELEGRKTSKGRTFAAAADHYVATVSALKKEGSAEWERRRFFYMAEFFGADTPLTDINTAIVGRWRDFRLKTVAPGTVLREYNLLRSLLNVARKEWKWLKESATDGVWMPKEEEDAREEFVWNWRQIRAILRFCESSEGAKTQEVGKAFHIALRTALRLQEVFLAKMVNQVIVIDNSKTTKKGRIVKIPTTRHGRRVMTKYAKQVWTVGANEASTLFHEACINCGLRQRGEDGVTFHDSRATALTHMSKRMPVQHLQKISRHRDINILIRRYYRETAEQISATL